MRRVREDSSRLQPDSSLCRRCAGKYSKQMRYVKSAGGLIIRFSVIPAIVVSVTGKSLSMNLVKSIPQNIVCGDCGLTRARLNKSETICHACYYKRLNGEGKCTFTGCSRVNRELGSGNSASVTTPIVSPRSTEDYVKSYHSRFPQNVRYFLFLTAKLRVNDSDSVVTTIRAKT